MKRINLCIVGSFILLFSSFIACKAETSIQTYKITFNENNGTGYSQTRFQYFTSGQSQPLMSVNSLGFRKEDFIFKGWATTPDTTESIYSDGETYTAKSDLTLYAIWTPLPTYTVTFNVNDGTETPETKTQTFIQGKQTFLMPIHEFNLEYSSSFIGWATSPDATEAEFSQNESYIASEDIVLYAVWEFCTVTFNANDGSQTPEIVTWKIIKGKRIQLPTPEEFGFEKEHSYVFGNPGWLYTQNNSSYSANKEMQIEADIVFYTYWSQTPSYLVTFDTDIQDIIIQPQQVFIGETAQIPDSLTKTGYSFDGWYLGETEFDFSTPIYGNKSLKAKWTPIHYPITINSSQNGSVSSNDNSLFYKEIGTLIVSSEPAYTIDTISIVDSSNNIIELRKDSNDETKYIFEMPAAEIFVSATFKVFEYVFHESVTVLSAGTDGSVGPTGTYVYFGDYPQTIKPDNVTINYNETITMGNYTYYKGSDNYWYCSRYANCNKDNPQNIFSTNSEISNGTYYFFRIEPIKWRILNPDSSGPKLLFAEKILEDTSGKRYNYDIYKLATVNGTQIYKNNYKYSNIRAYLNGTQNQLVTDNATYSFNSTDWTNKGFLQTAFTENAQNKILVTNVDNSISSTNMPAYNPSWNSDSTYICPSTQDKIFPLSVYEITNSEYGLNTNYNATPTGVREATDYARVGGLLCQGIMTNRIIMSANFWLRSPDCSSGQYVHVTSNFGKTEKGYLMTGVNPDGSTFVERQGTFDVSDGSIGICPALRVNIE